MARPPFWEAPYPPNSPLLFVTETLIAARASAPSSVLILLDQSAAVDTVSQSILLSVLSNMRILCLGRYNHLYPIPSPQGCPNMQCWSPFAICTTFLGPIICLQRLSYHCYADDGQLYPSFLLGDPIDSARISACLSDISRILQSA